MIYEAFGVIQAVILSAVVKYGLHMDVKSSFMYYAVCILTALAFTAIVQFLIVYVGEIGKFLTILLLILQLTACGGTFPMELVPKFFNVISPFTSYAVQKSSSQVVLEYGPPSVIGSPSKNL